jgi:hypothetical protein
MIGTPVIMFTSQGGVGFSRAAAKLVRDGGDRTGRSQFWRCEHGNRGGRPRNRIRGG